MKQRLKNQEILQLNNWDLHIEKALTIKDESGLFSLLLNI